MKICILQNSMTMGGTDTFVINACKGLVQDGYEVTVVLSVDAYPEQPREKELLDTGVSVVKTCSLSNGIKSKLIHLKLLHHILREGRYDVFQTNIDLFNGPQMLVAWLAGVPVRVCHSHNAQQAKELRKGRTITVRIYQKIMRWLCWTFSNRRCGCSMLAMDFLFKDKWKDDPCSKIIYNGINLEKYQKSIDIKGKKSDLGLKNKYNIVTVGRIDFQKNPEFLLDVFAALTKIRDDVDLVWCGKGDKENIIRNKINKYKLNDRVHLLGTRNDIPDILKCSDIFLLPSRFEGLPIALIEAQAAGVPCIVSNTISKEVDAGGCFYIPIDCGTKCWTELVNDILDKKISRHCKEEKISKFSSEYMVQDIEKYWGNGNKKLGGE